MKIVYVPRKDANDVPGGDIVLMRCIKKHIKSLGVEIKIVPIEGLRYQSGAQALHLTQIYQLDVAEEAVEWATKQQIPILISPLFEESLSVWYRMAIQRHAMWYYLSRVLGATLSESVYKAWQAGKRTRIPEWRRQRKLLRSAHVVANSLYEASHLRKWFNSPDLAASIVPVGVDSEFYGSQLIDTRQPLPDPLESWSGDYVLQVGVISRRKNQEGLLRALHSTVEPIVLLGRPSPYDIDYYNEVQRKANERGNVVFIEYVSDTLLPKLYRNAAVHILPSWSERPGLVTLEAAASGCKVISTNRSPIWEYLGSRADYCDPAKPNSIPLAVQRALGKSGSGDLKRYVLTNYSWQQTAAKLKSVYERLLN